jgi:hypothetical protein
MRPAVIRQVVARSGVDPPEHDARPSGQRAGLSRLRERVLRPEIQGFSLALAGLCGEHDGVGDRACPASGGAVAAGRAQVPLRISRHVGTMRADLMGSFGNAATSFEGQRPLRDFLERK